MTIPDFLTALPDLKDHFVPYLDELGMLRCRARHPTAAAPLHTPLTALCVLRYGVHYDPLRDWDRAALALGLSLRDASEIVSGEDNDRHAQPGLALALRQALGVGHE